MLTIDKLTSFGANVKEGMNRCLNNEQFYLMLVDKSVRSPAFDQLKDALDQKDLTKAFELSHSLKGVVANLALTPILTPISKMTEMLRNREDADYSELVTEVLLQRDKLLACCNG